MQSEDAEGDQEDTRSKKVRRLAKRGGGKSLDYFGEVCIKGKVGNNLLKRKSKRWRR